MMKGSVAMQKINDVDTIIFDAGGVLFYINEYRNAVMSRILTSKGFSQEKIKSALDLGAEFDRYYFSRGNDIVDWKDEKKWLTLRTDVISKALDDDDQTLADQLKYLALDTFQYTLFDETIEILERLKSNYKLTVLSNATASLDWAFDYLGIRQYFDEVIISSYEKCAKPSEKIYNIALNKVNRDPDQCIFIDDKVENVEVAQSIGLNTFHLKREVGMSLYDFENHLTRY